MAFSARVAALRTVASGDWRSVSSVARVLGCRATAGPMAPSAVIARYRNASSPPSSSSLRAGTADAASRPSLPSTSACTLLRQRIGGRQHLHQHRYRSFSLGPQTLAGLDADERVRIPQSVENRGKIGSRWLRGGEHRDRAEQDASQDPMEWIQYDHGHEKPQDYELEGTAKTQAPFVGSGAAFSSFQAAKPRARTASPVTQGNQGSVRSGNSIFFGRPWGSASLPPSFRGSRW